MKKNNLKNTGRNKKIKISRDKPCRDRPSDLSIAADTTYWGEYKTRPYIKPKVFSEEIMGVAALACGKCAAAGLKQSSFTCKQLPSGS